jgi:hypothetical protein
MVQDGDIAAPVLDRAFALQGTGGQADAGAIGAKHFGQPEMRDLQRNPVGPILHDQEPAREALFHTVQAVSGCGLGSLHALNRSIATKNCLNKRIRRHDGPERVGAKAEAISSNLHNGAVGGSG